MKCVDCEHFHIMQEPLPDHYGTGMAACDKHDLRADFFKHGKLKKIRVHRERGNQQMNEVNKLWKLYEEYKETAEQCEFPILLLLDARLKPAYEDLQQNYDAEHEKSFIRVMKSVLGKFGIDTEQEDKA